MSFEIAKRKAKSVLKKYGTNLNLLCVSHNIEVRYKEMPQSIKGLFQNCMRNKFIVINQNLNEFEQKMVLAHELGHFMLHNDICNYFTDNSFMNIDRIEMEANIFASHFIVEDNQLEYLDSRYSADELYSINNHISYFAYLKQSI